jgi:ferredoxin--NADP+ reductase
VRFAGPEGEEVVPCSSVLTAIGFEAVADAGLPRDALIAAAQDVDAGRLAPGLYAAGWFRRGPRGTIPENRADAQALAALILGELSPDPAKQGRKGLAGLTGTVDYDGWCRIDAAEVAAAPEGRCRTKMASREEMLRIAAQKEMTQ